MNRKMKRLLSLAVVLFMLMAQLGANIVNISAVRAETLDETAVSEGLTEGSSTAGSAGDGEAAPPAEAPDEDAAATGDSAVSGEVSSAPELPDEATAATDDSEAAETLPADVPDEEADASQEAADETDSTSASEEASDAGDAGEAAAGTEGETSAPPAPDNETDAAEDAETEAEASQNPGAPAPFSDFGIRGFGISPQKLNPGETIKEIQAPVPNTFKVMVGTALSAIGLPATIKVVYNKTDGTEEARDEDVTWAAADPAAPYDPEKDGDYTLKATFTDDSLKDQVGPNVTVTVQGQAVADEIEALPSVADAANLQMAEKDTLRSQLIAISNALSDFGPDEMTALEAYLGAPEMDKYQELYGTYVSGGDYSIADFLDGDWAYLRRFELDGIQDGTGPFDTSNDPDDPSYCNRPGNDDGPNNGKVRTFDTVSYDISYQTDVSGEYLGITNGYLYYEFILPYPTDQAEWEFTGMAWIGRKLANKADLATKKDGEGYYHYEVREVDGVMSQVITGKRFLAPVAPNPAAIPGAGTLNAVMRVLNADNNAQLRPKFRAWLDHNHTDGECPVHSREEVKSFVANPVTVTSELRMNVQLKSVSLGYANGLDTFDFTTGNELALNKDKGNVYGRLTAFGVTLQVYNPDPNDGLKGVAFPTGPITFDVDFAVKFQRDDGTVVNNLPSEYTPLVWSYERNKGGNGQSDGRSIATYAPLQYAVGGAPHSPNTNGPSTAYSPLTGSGSVWNGGNWTATQITDSKVSFTVDNYVVNPNYFPNTDAGNTTSAATYFDPANGVRSTNIGAISGGEIFVITPFGEGANYLPVRYAGNGTIQMDIVDSNLRANSNAGSLDIVTDNSNQTKPTRVPLKDDRLSNTVYLSMPGTWTNMIRYIKSVNHNYNTDIKETLENINNGEDTATRGQEFAILWGGIYDPQGAKANTVYGLNALMKFDPNGLELNGAPGIHLNTYYRDPKQTATFLYAVKKDGLTWADDAEMDATVETELDYYETLGEAKTHGVVVGILAEARNVDPKVDLTHIFFSVPVKVREDAETSKVYQIVTRSKVWKKAQYDEAGGLIPRRYDDGEDVSYPLIPVYYDLKGNPHTLDNWSPGPYVKAVYTDGVYKEGHRGSCNIGDSVYVTPYIVAIKKAVAQTAGGDEKKNFDLDTNQRTVDFKLSSSIKTLVSSSSNLYTDVEIVDVLPKGLRYIDNSAYFGGSYTQNPTPGRQGTVTGGTPADPIAVLNPSTGETTLTWKLDNFRVNDPIPNIIFSAAIGTVGSPDDVINNQQLLNRTWIRATHDNRAKIKSNGNYDEVGIRVSKLLATSLAKLAESKYVETSDDICWKAYVSNNGVNPYTNTVILDVLPYVGDSGGTKLANPAVKLDLIDWSVNKGETTLDNLDTWLAFYTTDETVRGTRSDDYVYDDILNLKSTLDNGDIVIWKPATFDPVSGKVSGVTGNVTALAFLGTLKGGQTLVQNIKLDPYYDQPPYDLKAGDILSNNLSRGKDVTDSPVYVLQRTLEGLLWHDDNADGTRQSGEVLFAEGTVSLLMEFPDGTYNVTMDSYENPAVIPLGKQLDLATGTISDYEPGKYKFVGLPAGNFGVRFTTDNIDVFTASPQNVGNDYTDSDAAPEFSAGGKLESTIITGIKMPPKDEMASSLYASVCNDSGLYARIKIYGTKTWDDAGNQDGKRPGTLVVQVKKGDSVVKSVTLDGVPDAGAGATGEIADWMYQFMDLPKFLKGELVQYEIAETGYEPYTPTAITQPVMEASKNAYTVNLKNSYTPEVITISGQKSWDDDDNRDRRRPLTLVVQVKNGDIVVKSVTLDGTADAAANETGEIAAWTYQFTGLPKYADGKLISYTIAETGYDPYTPTITQPVMEAGKNEYTVNLKNSYTPDTIKISGKKTWDDAGNQDGKRPATLVVNVKNGETVVKSVTLDGVADAAADATGEIAAWTYQFTGLPKYAAGVLISYTIEETGYAPYTPTTIAQPVMEASKDEYTVNLKNSYTPEVITISGAKSWDDAGNRDRKRPLTLVVQVKNGDIVVKEVTLDGTADAAANATGEVAPWKYQFTGLPKYAAGKLISYTIAETGYDPYTPTITQPVMEAGKNEYTVDLMNKYTPEVIRISGTKTWNDAEDQDGKRPAQLVVNVKNGETVVKSVTLDGVADSTGETAAWTYQFTGLPKYAAGVLISYTIEETGYAPYTPTTITQPVMEASKDEYTVDLKNSYTPEVIKISGKKTWDDAEDQDRRRPATLVVQVKNGDIVVKSVTLDGTADAAADKTGEIAAWTYQFTDLPKYAAGKLISYTIAETGYDPYTPTITQPVMEASKNEYTVNLKNSYTPDVIKISGTKTWNDAEDQDGKRPATLVVNVKNGETVVKTVTLDGTADAAANATGEIAAWTYQFTDLPKYAAGELIKYTIEETGYDPYTPTAITQPVMEASKNAYTVDLKNSYTPEVIRISGKKTWDDSENQDGKRPATLVVNVKNGATVVKSVTLDGTADAAAGETGEIAAWTYQFTDLPKYAAGDLIGYTIEETGYDPYTPATITQPVMDAAKNEYTVDLKNSYTPEVIKISGKKTWADAENRDGKRPATLVIHVKNGATVVKSVTLDGVADATGEIAAWTYQFTDLPKYAAGELIVYTIEETGYEPYTPMAITQPVMEASKNEYTVDLTNNYAPGMTIKKTAKTDTFTAAGDEIEYEVVVTNTGNVTLKGVEVTDSLVPDLKTKATLEESINADGELEVGETWTYTYTYEVTQADMDAGFVKNAVKAWNPDIPVENPNNPPPEDEVEVPGEQNPGMTIKKTAKTDTFTAAGDEIEYEIVVTNTGNVTLKKLVVTDSLDVDLETEAELVESMNPDGDLEVGETWTYTYTYEVTQADMDAGFVRNAVKATSPNFPDDDPNNPPPEDEVDVPGEQNPGMTVKKTVAPETKFTAAGDKIEYTIVVTNTGNVTLKDVKVTDSLDVDLETEAELVESINADGYLEVGETWTYTYTYEVTQEDMDAGFVKNAVKVTNPDIPDGDPENPPPEDEVDVPGEQNPGMSIKKTAKTEKYTVVGDEIEYEIVVTNTGNVTLKDVEVEDSLVPELTKKVTPEESMNADGDLEVGETWTYKYTYAVTQEDVDAGFVKNAVKAWNPDIPDEDPENPPPEDEVVVVKPRYLVEKTATEDRYFNAGDTIHYTVTVTNLEDVTVEGLTVKDSLVDFADMELTESVNTNGDLDVGEVWTLTYSYEVTEEDVTRGSVLNRVTVTNPADPDKPVEDEEEVFKPSYTVTKEADEACFCRAGDTIHYTVTVSNTGELDIHDLEIEDSLADFEEMELVEDGLENGILDVDETWTLTYSYTVTEADAAAGHVLNKVTVTDPADPENPEEDEETVPKSSYTVVKEVIETEFYKAGDILHYTITVTNTGEVAIGDLVVEDSLVALDNMKLVESVAANGILDVGETWVLTYTYTVTEADAVAGSVLNKVIVTELIEGEEPPENPPTDEVITPRVPDPNEPTPVPRTGRDDSPWSLWLGLILLSAGAVLVLLRKKGFLDANDER